MNRFTPEKCFQIVGICFNLKQISPRPFCGQHNRPSEQPIRAVIDHSRTNFSLLDSRSGIRQKRTEEYIAVVARNSEEDAEMLIPRRSQPVGPLSFDYVANATLSKKLK